MCYLVGAMATMRVETDFSLNTFLYFFMLELCEGVIYAKS